MKKLNKQLSVSFCLMFELVHTNVLSKVPKNSFETILIRKLLKMHTQLRQEHAQVSIATKIISEKICTQLIDILIVQLKV